VENLTSGELFKGISFDVHKGEIFGIGGLVGSMRTETLEALFGMRPITDGKIFLNGEEFHPTNPRQAIIQNRVCYRNRKSRTAAFAQNINLVSSSHRPWDT
jgi:ABC-type sugar transport system ATPase subunit